jgi:toxin ParE1/3/4
MAELRLSPAAERDLEGIWRYTAERWGVAQADHYIDLLHAAMQAVAQAPTAAPACDAIRPGYRRQWAEQHALYYQVRRACVVVVRVLQQRMDASRHV